MSIARVVLLAAALCLVAPTVHAVGGSGVFTFTVTRDGEPIGDHRVAFRQDGKRTEIDATMDLEVKFAMVPLYRFSHQRTEVWEDGRPLLIRSKTDDNGEHLDITLRPNGHGYLWTVNGRTDRLDPSTRVLALWNYEMVKEKPGVFVSVVEDEKLELAFALVGKETLQIDGHEVPVEHYRMTGAEERDIWYDPDGQVARVRFERGGDEIEYLRNEYRPLPLDGGAARP
jgi:hypothetical protein